MRLLVLASTCVVGLSNSEDVTSFVQAHVTPKALVSSGTFSAPQAMVNFGDAQYVSYMKVGRQIIAGIIDTGSFELVVFGADCRSCGVAAHYNSFLSNTFTPGLLMSQQNFGSGSTQSVEAHEMVSIGDFPAQNQTFWNVQQAQMPVLFNAAFEAIIGVGPPETPAADAWRFAEEAVSNVSAFFEDGVTAPAALVESSRADIMVAKEMSRSPPMLKTFNITSFSVCLGAKSGSDGIFVWNDQAAPAHPGMFATVPVVGNHTWSALISNVGLRYFGDESGHLDLGCGEGCSAILDTGTSLLAVPSFFFEKVKAAMGKLDASCSNINDLPEFVFELGGHSFSLPPDAYIAEVVGDVPNYLQNYLKLTDEKRETTSPKCQLMLMESSANATSGPVWILGIPFFRKYYTTFNLGQNTRDRSFAIAEHTEDCSPTAIHSAHAQRAEPNVRRVVASRIHLPQAAQRAASEHSVRL